MKKIGLTLLLLVLPSPCFSQEAKQPGDQKPKDDLAQLQGRWQTVFRLGPKGKQLAKDNPRQNQVLEVEGNVFRLTIQRPDVKPLSGNFKLTPTENPKLFDLAGTGPLGFEIELHGIYELSDDTFRLSIVQCGKGKPFTRPTAFDGEQGGDYFVFKRAVTTGPKSDKSGPAALISKHEDHRVGSKLIGLYRMTFTGLGKGESEVQFSVYGEFIENGKMLGRWHVQNGKVTISYDNLDHGTTTLSFTDNDTLLGRNVHKNGVAFDWVVRRKGESVGNGGLLTLPDRMYRKGPLGKLTTTSVKARLFQLDDLIGVSVYEGTGRRVCGLAYSPTTIEGWDVESGKRRFAVNIGPARSDYHDVSCYCEVATDEKILLVGGKARQFVKGGPPEPVSWVAAWDVEKNTKLWEMSSKLSLKGSLLGMTLSANGKTAALSILSGHYPNEKSTILVIDAVSGKQSREIQGNFASTAFRGQDGRFDAFRFSPDGCWLVSGKDGIKVFNTETWEQAHWLRVQKGHILQLAFSGDSRRIVSYDSYDMLNIWDIHAGKVQATLGPKEYRNSNVVGFGFNRVSSAALSRDGTQLACVGTGGTTVLWDTRQKQVQPVFLGYLGNKIEYHPTRAALIFSGSTPQLSSWDIE